MSKGKLLIVEDEFVVAENLRTDLISMGYKVEDLASSGTEAMELARRKKPDLVLMDIKLRGEMDGVDTAIRLRKELDIPVLFLTAFADESVLERAKLAEPLGYLVKPYERKGLRASIEMAHFKARMERLLKESESRFRSMFENSSVAYLALDDSDRCLDLNGEFCELLGYGREELIGKYFVGFLSTETRRLYLEQSAKLKDYGRLQTELELVRKDGSLLAVLFEGRVQCNIDGKFLRSHCIVHNMTERKRVEEERLQLMERRQQIQKAESLARMAGAIIHQCNNMIGVVMGNLELCQEDLPHESKSQRYIAEAMKASHRATEITRFMRTYLGQDTGRKEPLDLRESVMEAQVLLIGSIPGNIRLETDLSSPGPIIRADGAHIKKILVNLVSNAAEAIGQKEGHIKVAVNVVSSDEIRKAKFYPLDFQPKARNYACLSVADNDNGLDAEVIERIFDPFFTTRLIGRGLGLPIVLGLLRIHEGAITVQSVLGEGTLFRVYFPIPEQEELTARHKMPTLPGIEGGGLVLVVDDEPMVRNLAQSMLKRMGFEVELARDGREAVEIFRTRAGDFRLVLLDLTMPGINGWQTLSELRKLRPDIPVVLASGYDEAHVIPGDHPERPQAFLQKPYLMADLIEALAAAKM